MSKREELRAKRRKEQQRNRIIFIIAAALIAVGLAAVIVVPKIVESQTPVGPITQITPVPPPMVS